MVSKLAAINKSKRNDSGTVKYGHPKQTWAFFRQHQCLGKDFKVLLPPCGLKDVNEIYSKKGWTLDKAINMKWLNYAKPASEVTVPKIFENN